MSFVRARFFKGKDPRTEYLTSSIWYGVHEHSIHILKEAHWILGMHSSVNFLLDNWLGYSIADRLGIPCFVREFLNFSVADYFCYDSWHLDEFFVMKHMDIIQDILKYSCEADEDTLVWPHELHGHISSRGAFRSLRPHFPEVNWGVLLVLPVVYFAVITRRMSTIFGVIAPGLELSFLKLLLFSMCIWNLIWEFSTCCYKL
ncbi:hypothetical protein ACS0TY_022514 [Phlomoides rotata]